MLFEKVANISKIELKKTINKIPFEDQLTPVGLVYAYFQIAYEHLFTPKEYTFDYSGSAQSSTTRSTPRPEAANCFLTPFRSGMILVRLIWSYRSAFPALFLYSFESICYPFYVCV